ncbi:MAG TPA: glycosyltransferase family 2 protein [Solirubrobacteraceae bacterium]|nr:glycosyltransferase family 2 protein [Solirubrobacteraceae bacterium]
MSPEAMPFVSIVVVCWNSADVLGRCLEQLFAQDYPNREIVVVDDGSDDGTGEVAERASRDGELTLVRSSSNCGCPAARNLGLRHASGEIVAFIDADGFADARWLTEVVRAFGDDETIGGVASTVFYEDDPLVLNGAGGTVNRQGWAADLSMNEPYGQARLATEALYPMGCGMALRRAALERVGPFDDAMLNYYDDVDYGTRLWRAGYSVLVAHDAWIDHATAAGESERKRLLCERHRMRVVLKYTPRELLGKWFAQELSAYRQADGVTRRRKRAAAAWNMRRLSSTLAARRDAARRDGRGASPVPTRLFADSWGDRFPAGVTPRPRPRPENARAFLDMSSEDAQAQLPYGWFPRERVGSRSCRWATPHAAVLISLDRPARRLHLDYTHVPEEIDGIALEIRRTGAGVPTGAEVPTAPVWETRLRWQYLARSIENHPIELESGDYELIVSAEPGWLEPPRNERRLALALARLSFEETFDLAPVGLDMGGAGAEGQLISGWFEAEQSPTGAYRWSSAQAAAVVRVERETSAMRMRFRLTPGRSSVTRITARRLADSEPVCAWEIVWEPGEWREEAFAARLPPGDYRFDFEVQEPWSNIGQQDRELPPENRALGFALSALSFDAAVAER